MQPLLQQCYYSPLQACAFLLRRRPPVPKTHMSGHMAVHAYRTTYVQHNNPVSPEVARQDTERGVWILLYTTLHLMCLHCRGSAQSCSATGWQTWGPHSRTWGFPSGEPIWCTVHHRFVQGALWVWAVSAARSCPTSTAPAPTPTAAAEHCCCWGSTQWG